MIERKFVAEKLKEFQIQEFMSEQLKRVGMSHTRVQKTPLGEKIIVYASKPGLVVGRSGENIKKMTKLLKKQFDLENPQIEIAEVENPALDAHIVAETIASSLERFGISKFKGIGHKALEDAMRAGALGIEVLVSGKVPSSRAKSWRFYQGYLKKCGDVALQIRTAYAVALLKSGIIGIQVRIMPPDIRLADRIDFKTIPPETAVGPIGAGNQPIEVKPAEQKDAEKPKKKRAAPRKKKAAKTEKAETTPAAEPEGSA